MVPLKKVRNDTSSPSDSTCRTLAFTSMPGPPANSSELKADPLASLGMLWIVNGTRSR